MYKDERVAPIIQSPKMGIFKAHTPHFIGIKMKPFRTERLSFLPGNTNWRIIWPSSD